MFKPYPFLKSNSGKLIQHGNLSNQNIRHGFKAFLTSLIFFAVFLLGLVSFRAEAGIYYSNNAATSSVNNWWTGTAGTGSHPSDFTTSGDIFILQMSQTCVTAGNWTIGAGVTLQIDGKLSITNSNTTVTINGTVIFTSVSLTQVTLAGSGSGNTFDLSPGATLKSANLNGISGTNCSLPVSASKKTVTLNTSANYEFNGTASQASAGLPATVNNLNINNTAGVTGVASLTVNGTLTVNSGVTFAPTGTITMGAVTSGISNSGTLTFSGLTIGFTPTAQSQYNASYNVAGTLTVNSGVTFAPTGGTITRTGTAWATTLTGATVTFFNYTIAGTPATQPTSGYSVAGTLAVNASTILAPTAGTITMSAATSSINNSGTITFYNLTIASTPTAQSQYNTSYSVADALTVNAGVTFAPTGGTITRTGTAWTTTLTGTATFYNYTIAGTPAVQPTTSYSVTGTFAVNASTTLSPTAGTITMTGVTSAVNNAGTLTFYNLTTNNSSGLNLTGLVTVSNILDFQGGLITPAISLTLGSSGSITNASSSKYVNGKLNMIFSGAGSKTFPIGKGGNYRPVTFAYITLTGTPSTVSFEQFESQMTGTLPGSTNIDPNRYWDFSQSGGTSYAYIVTLDPTGFTSTGTVVQLKKDAGTVTSKATTTPNYSNSTNYVTISSPTSIALGSDCSATSSNAGADQTSSGTCGLTTVSLAATAPTYGTGLWTVFTGAGGSFGTASSQTSTFSGTAGTAYNVRWTVTNGNCTANSTVNVTFNINPTPANAGPDQTDALTCGLTSLTLAGNSPTIGTGAWSIVSGSGGSFANGTDPSSTFSGTLGIAYVLRWTITNGSCSSSDDVNITLNSNPTTANAGPDQSGLSTCGLIVTLAANNPSAGTGLWSVVAGAGGSFSNTANAASTFTGTSGTAYTLRWTITNACGSSSDDVDVTFSQSPTTANAGANQTGAATCGLTTVNLAGNSPIVGTGAWSIISGTGGTVTTPTSPTSVFSGTAGTTYTLRWTISNSPCTASTSDVLITFNQNPTTANAGANQTGAATCGLTTVTLSGNSPTVGAGAWTIISGTGGTVTTPTSPTSVFSGTAGTTYTLRWTISNSPCTASTSDVLITFNQNPTTANAGANQTGAATCGLTAVTLSGNSPTVGAGAWSIISGTGGSVTTPTSPTSIFSGTAGTTYTLRWTTSNSSCTASTSDVLVTFNQNPATPTAQATTIVLTPSTTSIAGSFTASSPAATGYIVIRTATGTQPTNPVDGTSYTVGSTALGGYIEASGSGATFTSTALWPSTQYWYWVYSYNNNFCSGGPKYLATAPLTGNQITSGCGSVTTKTWALAGGGDFNTAANWSPAGVPSSCDSVVIDMNGTITLSGNATIGALTIRVNGNNNKSFFDAGSYMFTVLRTTTASTLSGNPITYFKMHVRNGGVITMIGDYTASSFDALAKIYPIDGDGGASTGQFIFRGNVTLGTGGSANFTISEMPGSVIFDATGTQTLTESSGGFAFGNTSTEIGLINSPTVIVTGSTKLCFAGGDLNINKNSTLDLTTSTFNRYTVGGSLNIRAGAMLKLAASTGGKTGSNFPANFSTISIDPTSTVEYNAVNGINQTVYAPVTYGNLILTNPTGSGATTKNLTANVTGIEGNITINPYNTFDLQTFTANRTSAGGSLSLAANAIMKLSAGAGGQTGSNFPSNFTTTLNAASTVEYYGIVAQTIYPTPVYGHLTISNNATKTAGSDLTVMGNVLIQTSGIFAGSTYSHQVAGNWTNNSSATAFTGSGLVTFNGSALQTIGGTSGSNFNNLTINNSGTVNLGQAEFVNALLTLSAGNINLLTYNLTINGSSAVAGTPFSATKMIIADGGGELRKSFSANGSYLFPIGDNTGGADYSPVTIDVTGASYASAWIGASVTDAKHPNNQSTTNFLTRYWKVNQSGIGTCSASVTGKYLNSASDISGTEAGISSAQLSGGFIQLTNPWRKFSTLSANTLVANGAVITPGQTSVFTGITLQLPTVIISGGGVTICNGNSVALTTSVTGDPTFAYAWTPTTGLSSSTVANPAASPSTTTTYSVTAYDGNGITATATAAQITVNPRPTGVISGTTSFCAGGSAVLSISVTGTGPWNGTLSNGASLSGSASPITLSVSPASTTIYTITTLSDANCTAIAGDKTGSAVVTVNTLPAITSQPSSATKCVGQSQTFTVTATGTSLTYQWRKGGVNISGATSSSFNIASVTSGDAGSYDVVVSGTCPPSVTSTSVTLTINTLPAITGQPTPATLCSGQSQTFTVTATGTSLTYQWRKGGVNISGATSSSFNIASVTSADAGSYDVVVSGTCPPSVTSTSVTLTINTLPAITGQPTPATLCSGQSQTFTVTATGTSLTYQWRKGGVNISGATSSSFNIASVTSGDAGSYDVVVSGTCSPSVTSASVSLAVNTAPVITTNPVSQAVCSGTSVNFSVAISAGSNTGISYQWKKNGTDISGATSSSYSIPSSLGSDAGNYTVVVTSCATTVTSATATLSVSTAGTWLGINTDWNDVQNWCGGVPTLTTDVTIPVTGSNIYPIISAMAYSQNITIAGSASIIVNNATLQITGTINNSGIFDASTGTIEMSGITGQTIPANLFLNSALNNLVISNTSASGISIGGSLDIFGSVTFSGTGMKLVTNDNVTIKSTAVYTAWVGDVTGNTITGKVTVERYIPAHKAWQFLSVPTNTTQNIKQAWQEGAASLGSNPTPGFGTQITSNRSTWSSDGFDTSSASPSMKTFDPATNGWVGVAGTNSGAIKTTDGYFIFVRGDRTATSTSSSSTQTVLRTKGTLYIGDQPSIAIGTSKFAAIGNPFASALDMRNITKTGLKDFFYLWDPNIAGDYGYGGYQTFSNDGSGNYVITPGGGSYGAIGTVSNYIKSGLAFFVQATATGGSVTLKESSKSSGSGQISTPVSLSRPQLRISLSGVNPDNTAYIADGVLINYDDTYSNAIDDMDALKSYNTSENLAIKTSNKLLVVERRHTIVQTDTTFLNLANVKIQNYTFQLIAEQLYKAGRVAFLVDNYLKTKTPVTIDGSTTINFTVNSTPASYAVNRFMIVFNESGTLPVTFTSIDAFPLGTNIEVAWKVDNESNIKQYDVEKSTNGNRFNGLSTTAAQANNFHSASYSSIDVQPVTGYNYYRVKSVDLNGQVAYTSVVKVLFSQANASISVFPNSVVNGIVNVQMVNQPAGIYRTKLMNSLGQLILEKTITHSGGNASYPVQLDKYTAHGIYSLEILSKGQAPKTIKIVY